MCLKFLCGISEDEGKMSNREVSPNPKPRKYEDPSPKRPPVNSNILNGKAAQNSLPKVSDDGDISSNIPSKVSNSISPDKSTASDNNSMRLGISNDSVSNSSTAKCLTPVGNSVSPAKNTDSVSNSTSPAKSTDANHNAAFHANPANVKKTGDDFLLKNETPKLESSKFMDSNEQPPSKILHKGVAQTGEFQAKGKDKTNASYGGDDCYEKAKPEKKSTRSD